MAGNVQWAEMLDLIMIELPQCPKAVAMQCAKLAAIAFCADSGIWLHYPDAADVEAGNRDVSIDPPAGARIATALSVKLNGADLEPTSIQDLTALYTNWQSKTGTPTRYWIDENDIVKLWPTPSTAMTGALVVVATAAPKLTSDAMPAWIWETWHVAISKKAKAIAFAMPKKPWTDMALAGASDAEYREQLAQARYRAARAGGNAELTTAAGWM